jgi:hypothetical protein
MKNYSNKRSKTLIKDVGENTPFIKIKDLFPEKRKFEKGDVPILGFIKVHSKMYNKDQYSLLVNYKGEDYFLNVPTWYGAAVEEDFSESGQTAAEFFDNAYIEEIEEFETKFNNNSFNIKIYEG